MRLTGVVLAAVLATSNVALAQQVEDYSETIELFRGIPQVAPYFGTAYGYAVWERIGRGGLGIGGATGRGQVYVDGKVTGFSRLADITIGATVPIVGRASTPNDIPNPNTAIENGATFLAPWAKLKEPPGSSIGSRTLSVVPA